MEARIYYIKKSSAIEAEDVAAHQNDIVGSSYTTRKVIKLAEENDSIDIYIAIASNYSIMREIAEEFATEINQEDVVFTDEVKVHNEEHVKIEMLNIAGPVMEAYFGDLALDLKDVEQMHTGDIAYWYVRQMGTGLRMNEFDRYRQDMQDWGDKALRKYRIYKHGYDEYIILPYTGE